VPPLVTIIGHWDRKVRRRVGVTVQQGRAEPEHSRWWWWVQILFVDHATGEGGILHNDPLVMRNDTNPIMDAPLNTALRMPGCIQPSCLLSLSPSLSLSVSLSPSLSSSLSLSL
jgi:hypothetical protein